ncbi:unnamed protein product [Moneuplotes crassus]|uniref:Acyl-CoA dehydrogenase n=1 Tax=Euplotes crassus TaxID=5936 RepID=A0AAD1UD47_EUPCR|nr:unnamed protein product [Moneuplotes crassus]
MDMDKHLKEIQEYSQAAPKLGNQYTSDTALKTYLSAYMPESVLQYIKPDLIQFGEKVAGEYLEMAHLAEDEKPYLVKHDAYGRRIDEVRTCEGWKFFKPEAAKEGLISIPYESELKQYSRLYQMVKLYLFAPSSGLFSCPLAMTDGAAFTIRELQKITDIKDYSHLGEAYKHLTSRDPSEFWTSGQWMTEKKGGSDVSNGTTTLAEKNPSGDYSLYGYKWFTSATDADMTLTLARGIKDGNPIPGKKGLSLYFSKIRDDQGHLNNLEVIRLKDKLGTRQLPTGEILLKGTIAEKIGKEGEGVRFISNMLNITRMHNSISAVSNMRRIIALARDYSHKRETFGKKIEDHDLHYRTLAWMEMTFRGNLIFLIDMASMLGRIDVGKESTNDKVLFRLLTPVIKLFTAKDAMKLTSEGLECFGGLGYMENSHLPSIFRDSQVLPIWEGTTNILSLDLLRAIIKWPKSLDVLYDHLSSLLSLFDIKNIDQPSLKEAVEKLSARLDSWYKSTINIVRNKQYMEFFARTLAFNISLLYICHKLLMMYHITKGDKEFETLLFWVNRLEKEYEAPKEPRMYECYSAREKMMGLDKPTSDNKEDLTAKI